MGCYSQIRSEDIKNIDGVDIIIGNTNKSRVVLLVEEYLKNKKSINKIEDIMHTTFEPMELDSFETRTRAFVKVQDGCNNFCSYCIIPYTRGNIRSKEKEDVVNEIKCLVTDFDNDIFNDILYRGTYEECEAYIFDFDENTGKSEALTDILGILKQEKHINTNYFIIDDDEYDKENGRISFYITSRKTSEEYKIIFDIL